MPLREREERERALEKLQFWIHSKSPLSHSSRQFPQSLFFLFLLTISFSTDFAAYCFLFLSSCDLSGPAKYFDWSCIRTIHGTRLELGIPCASSLQETFLFRTLKSALVALEGHAVHCILWIRISIASLWKALTQTETLINP